MKINKLTPIIYTKDIAETIDFYSTILGFQCVVEQKDWAILQLDNVEIMISIPNDHIPFDKAIFTGSFYFNIDDVNEFWNSVHNKVKLCYPIEDFEYDMREFGIYDNNNYLLQFGEAIENNKN